MTKEEKFKIKYHTRKNGLNEYKKMFKFIKDFGRSPMTIKNIETEIEKMKQLPQSLLRDEFIKQYQIILKNMATCR